MTDLEMTKLCAEAMEYEILPYQAGYIFIKRLRRGEQEYKPLHDNAQCFALALWLSMRGTLSFSMRSIIFTVEKTRGTMYWTTPDNEAKRRAIVECVAKIQQSILQPVEP